MERINELLVKLQTLDPDAFSKFLDRAKRLFPKASITENELPEHISEAYEVEIYIRDIDVLAILQSVIQDEIYDSGHSFSINCMGSVKDDPYEARIPTVHRSIRETGKTGAEAILAAYVAAQEAISCQK